MDGQRAPHQPRTRLGARDPVTRPLPAHATEHVPDRGATWTAFRCKTRPAERSACGKVPSRTTNRFGRHLEHRGGRGQPSRTITVPYDDSFGQGAIADRVRRTVQPPAWCDGLTVPCDHWVDSIRPAHAQPRSFPRPARPTRNALLCSGIRGPCWSGTPERPRCVVPFSAWALLAGGSWCLRAHPHAAHTAASSTKADAYALPRQVAPRPDHGLVPQVPRHTTHAGKPSGHWGSSVIPTAWA